MRPLIILCEPRHRPHVEQVIALFGHPRVTAAFIRPFYLDLQVEFDYRDVQYQVMSCLRQAPPAGSTQGHLVCATHEVERILRLRSFLKTQHTEFSFVSAASLNKAVTRESANKPQLAAVLNTCNLSLQGAAVELLSGWTHARLDYNALSAWKSQFGKLGKMTWIADAILAKLELISAPTLSERFIDSPLAQADIAAYNKDGRGVVKSGEVIANLLTKRFPGLPFVDAPATAIERCPTGNIAIVEDGLWTGTEAIGVIDSLLGKRPGREKSRPLADPALLREANLTLIYGIMTDYGRAMVYRYLRDLGLERIALHSAQVLDLASPQLLERIADPDQDVTPLRQHGPDPLQIRPYLLTSLDASLDVEHAGMAARFCRSLGQQLFDNYLQAMQEREGWSPWQEDKRIRCCLGMNGLGLTHAFGHSVPKASLPLLWGSGRVQWEGRKIDDWQPLFRNA